MSRFVNLVLNYVIGIVIVDKLVTIKKFILLFVYILLYSYSTVTCTWYRTLNNNKRSWASNVIVQCKQFIGNLVLLNCFHVCAMKRF